MKKFRYHFLTILTLGLQHSLYSQGVGISNTSIVADPSSILELRSTTQGLLVPRVTTSQRDFINSPANGLLVFNISTSSFNFYQDGWKIIGVNEASGHYSIDAGTNVTTTSTVDSLIDGMILTPGAGTYVVNFNSQCTVPEANHTTGFSTATAKTDLNLIYADITAVPMTDTHGLTFGSGETLTPGVYVVTGAASIAGSLTLDGGGNPDALFIIKSSAAFNTGANVIVTLTNGAAAHNIYWVAQDAIGLGAGTVIQGTIFSNSGAVAVGAGCSLTGRLLTKGGAPSVAASTISLPQNPSSINFRSLDTCIIFTGSGGVANSGASTYTGDIGTNLGAITGFEAVGCTVNGSIFQAGTTTVVTPVNHEATFSLYQNGVLISNSERTRTYLPSPADISLHGTAIVSDGETIEARWKVDSQISDDGGQLSVGKRVLTLTKVQ